MSATLPTFAAIEPQPVLALFTGLGHWELLIVLAIGLLLFGKRLPDVGRSLGRSIVEFKRGVKGIQDEIDNEVAEDRKELGAGQASDGNPYQTQDDRRVTQGERMNTPATDSQ
ncbi:MAG: twin-arginine translocase TatA/TatE family subunit [Planctomycetota bacterium]